MSNMLTCCIALAFIKICTADVDFSEIVDKLSAQTLSLFTYAASSEESYHDKMHLVVKYFLYYKYNDEPYELFTGDFIGINNSNFDMSKKTLIFVHGYTDHKDRKMVSLMRRSLSCSLDANVIVIDWRKPAGQIYFTAVTNTYHVGRVVGSFLKFLERFGVDLASVHIIGHSLGGHIAGVAGEYVDGKLGRITALDPAGPLFEYISERNNSLSLDPTDALFVDVIHSAIGMFGVVRPIGHADFYPNEGVVPQPGCNNIILAVTCSHVKSVHYFIESLNGTVPFLSKKCSKFQNETLFDCKNSLATMGYNCSHDTRGNFLVQTNANPPYAMGGKFYKRQLLID